jgi:hypothetical protein
MVKETKFFRKQAEKAEQMALATSDEEASKDRAAKDRLANRSMAVASVAAAEMSTPPRSAAPPFITRILMGGFRHRRIKTSQHRKALLEGQADRKYFLR